MQYLDVIKGSTLGRETYYYDMMNRVTSVTYTTGPTDAFQYYLDGELNTATLGNLGHALTYNLDTAGNRATVVDNTITTTYTPNVLNQYTAVTNSSITNGPNHEISDYQGSHYTYINDERLIAVSVGGATYQLAYDALGRCVKRTTNAGTYPAGQTTTYYIYDGEKPILEYLSTDLTHPVKNVYGKGVDEILMRTDPSVNGGAPFYYQQNHESSVTLLTNSSGVAIERYRYDVFGAPTIYDGNWNNRPGTLYNNRFLFTGREYNASFGFYEYRARAYSPTLGRFMSEDPKLFDAGDYNLFRYCHNDPIDMTDPMGLMAYSPQQLFEEIASTRELVGLSSTYMRAAQSATQGVTMAHVSRQESQTTHTYSLKSQYKIGDLSGARGYQYVWDSNDKCSGQCLTGVQHLTGTPNSSTPLVRGAAVDANTPQGMAIAKGWVLRNGQYVYPSKPAGQSDNHAAVLVAPIGKGYAQILSQYNISPSNRAPLHLEVVSTSGWHVITSPLPARTASGSELRVWDGSIPW